MATLMHSYIESKLLPPLTRRASAPLALEPMAQPLANSYRYREGSCPDGGFADPGWHTDQYRQFHQPRECLLLRRPFFFARFTVPSWSVQQLAEAIHPGRK